MQQQLLLTPQLAQFSIIQTVNSVGMTVDEKNWAACRGLFADKMEVDYTSLMGGEPAYLDATALILGWKQVLQPVQATQHVITMHQVTLSGDFRATCLSHVQAYHWHEGAPGGSTWIVWGTYHHRLVRAGGEWLVEAMKLVVKRQEGNRKLLQEAAVKG